MTEVLTNIGEILSSIQRNLKAPKDMKNNFGNFAYRNAEGILHIFKEEISKDIYPKNIRIITDFDVVLIGNRTFMKCTAILKVGGECEDADAFAELDIAKKGMDQAQLTGAATSYAKKYALCNLLAIDDSKSDPDADEKPKDEKKPERNAFGLTSDGPLAKGEDMLQTQIAENEETAKRLVIAIKAKKSIAELDTWLEKKEVASAIAKLKKYAEIPYSEVQLALTNFKRDNTDYEAIDVAKLKDM